LAYIGNDLQVAFPTYKNIDDISGSFNSSTTSFALLVSGAAPSPLPLNSQQCLISVGGVLQRPDDTGSEGFRLSGGNIVFSSAPATGADFFGVILAGADYVNAGGTFPDGSAAVPSITFSDDSDTGFFRSSSGAVSFSSNAVSSAIFGTNSFTAPSFIPTSSSVPTNGVFLPSANTVSISTNSTERARIDSSGRLLVGTSTARTDLMGLGAQFQLEGTSFTTTRFGATCNANNADGPGVYFAKSRGTTSGSVTVVNNGDVLGEIEFGGADGTNIDLAARIRGEVDGTPGANDMPGRLVFSTTADGASSPTERMRIRSSGEVLVNSTAQLDLTGQSFQVNGFSMFHQTSSGSTASVFTHTGSGTQTVCLFRQGAPAATVGSITVSGGSSTAYNTSSDYRLKENIAPVSDGITRLQQLKPSRFNFIVDPAKTVDGFIAHEVQAVVPEAVTGEKDAVDDDGNPVYQGIDQSKLVPLLTAALQEAIGEIESLKARVAALESV